MKFILGLSALLLFSACATKRNSMHYSDSGLFQSDLDSADRDFFYGSFLGKKGG